MPAETLLNAAAEIEKINNSLSAHNSYLEELVQRAKNIARADTKSKDFSFETDFMRFKLAMRALTNRCAEEKTYIIKSAKQIRTMEYDIKVKTAVISLYIAVKHLFFEAQKMEQALISGRPFFRKTRTNIFWWEIDKISADLSEMGKDLLKLARRLNVAKSS